MTALIDSNKYLVSEYRAANRILWSKVAIVQTGNYYTLLVASDSIASAGETDQTGRRMHPAQLKYSVMVQKQLIVSKAIYQLTAYAIGDIVIYKDDYYICRKATTASQNVILDPIYWDMISWKHGKDSNYRGAFDNTYTYQKGNIVVQEIHYGKH